MTLKLRANRKVSIGENEFDCPSRRTISRRAYEKADKTFDEKSGLVKEILTNGSTISIDFGYRLV
jgi:hypothetical protein